jgi:hypothetical protein
MDSPELIGGLRLPTMGTTGFPGPGFGGAPAKSEAPLPGCLVRPIVPEQGGYGPDGGSSAQDRPVRAQALKLSTPDPSTARASSSHAA